MDKYLRPPLGQPTRFVVRLQMAGGSGLSKDKTENRSIGFGGIILSKRHHRRITANSMTRTSNPEEMHCQRSKRKNSNGKNFRQADRKALRRNTCEYRPRRTSSPKVMLV